MSIFQREGADSPSQSNRPSHNPAPPAGQKQTTVVAAGSRVQGEISGGTDVMIHGRVEGQLVLGNSVVVGEGGEVRGHIEARQVRVAGKVAGDIRASERIEVLESGRIEGDVSAPRVAINAGAFFKGKVEMTSHDEPAAQTPPARPEQKKLDEPPARQAGSPSPAAAKS